MRDDATHQQEVITAFEDHRKGVTVLSWEHACCTCDGAFPTTFSQQAVTFLQIHRSRFLPEARATQRKGVVICGQKFANFVVITLLRSHLMGGDFNEVVVRWAARQGNYFAEVFLAGVLIHSANEVAYVEFVQRYLRDLVCHFTQHTHC